MATPGRVSVDLARPDWLSTAAPIEPALLWFRQAQVRTEPTPQIELLIHWAGGKHTQLTIPRNRPGQHRWSTDRALVDVVRCPQHPTFGARVRCGRMLVRSSVGRGSHPARFRSWLLDPSAEREPLALCPTILALGPVGMAGAS
jgi:hypothetical protein